MGVIGQYVLIDVNRCRAERSIVRYSFCSLVKVEYVPELLYYQQHCFAHVGRETWASESWKNGSASGNQSIRGVFSHSLKITIQANPNRWASLHFKYYLRLVRSGTLTLTT